MIVVRATLRRGCWCVEFPDGRIVHFGTERRAIGRKWITLPYARVLQGGRTVSEWDAAHSSLREYLAAYEIDWPRWDAQPMIMNGATA